MTTRKKAAAKKPAKGDSGAAEVEGFMRALDHPLKPALAAVRAIILGASPKVSEGIKWNSPSFRLNEYFATINIRNDEVLVIMHQGAKSNVGNTAGQTTRDPTGLMERLGKDRCAIRFRDLKAVKSGRAAFTDILRQWIGRMN